MKPTKIYAEHLEEGVMDQFNSAMECDFAVQGALMPDAHLGYSLPIGAVVATENVVVPAWVGYDIGCGMCAIPTTFPAKDIEKHSKEIFDRIYDLVPVGFKHHPEDQEWSMVNDCTEEMLEIYAQGCPRQLGTLGGGNHFIEIGVSDDGITFIIVHCGSRGIGHKTATHYMKAASMLHTGIPKAKEGHYGFDVDSEEGGNYLTDLNFCLDFALDNRRRIVHQVGEAIAEFCDGGLLWEMLINRNHNHAEFHDGLWIHRKGATHAEEGMMGVIPGNMLDGSFIVAGKGNPEALWSSSHGAGRIMGRKQAKKELDLDEFHEIMHGIEAKVDKHTLDESPLAYKDIHGVMELQTDLVEVIHHIKPLINVKG